MTNSAEKEKEIENFFDLSEITKQHQAAFNQLYRLSFSCAEENDHEPNPLFFTKVEDILDPIVTAWKEKYDLIKRLTGIQHIYWLRKGPPVNFTLDHDKSATLKRYYISGDDIPVKPLTIRHRPAYIFAHPQLTCPGVETYKLEVCFFKGSTARKTTLVITETEGEQSRPTSPSSYVRKDALRIEGEDVIGCMRDIVHQVIIGPKRSFYLPVNRLPENHRQHSRLFF